MADLLRGRRNGGFAVRDRRPVDRGFEEGAEVSDVCALATRPLHGGVLRWRWEEGASDYKVESPVLASMRTLSVVAARGARLPYRDHFATQTRVKKEKGGGRV